MLELLQLLQPPSVAMVHEVANKSNKMQNREYQMQAPYELFKLNYSYDALEPYIDAKTVELHYAKHTKTYVDKANEALSGLQKPGITEAGAYELSKQLDDNVGGILTHQLYFNCLAKPKEKGGVGGVFPTSGPFYEAVKARYGGFDGLKEGLKKGGLSRFGSGWVFLHQDLSITTAPNQEWPRGKKPILGIDVWEHAYYLKYQNRRVEYLDNIFFVINWGYVESLYKSV
ncbi:MAG: superoxide dismutase [Chlamydiae bacterium]|nr:superoxide dismutase [Chlamydiota bacterium]